MTAPSSGYQLDRFLETFDRWVESDGPADWLRRLVLAWLLNRATDPYADATREPGLPNYWQSQVPGSIDGDTAVLCAYFVHERPVPTVVCDQLATLSLPI